MLLGVYRKGRGSTAKYQPMPPGFDFEIRAVTAGIFESHARRQTSADSQRYLLRRAIHRIEKGLISRPRRPIFAADYIEEAVDLYCSQVAIHAGDPTGLLQHWAHDVLAEYFAIVGSHPSIDRARGNFQSHPCLPQDSTVPARPTAVRTGPPPLDIDSMLALAKRRRSVRHYLPRVVPREIVDRALAVASLSPTACNRQPYIFRIFDDPPLVQRIGSIPMGTKGFHEGFPCVAVIVGQLRAFQSPRDRHLIYIDGSLAAMSFIYALESQGVSSCCINWPEIAEKEEQIVEALGLAPDERPIMLISFGYADPSAMIPFSQKKPLSELRIYN